MADPTVLTPDFYDYAWHGLCGATIDDDFVVVEWPDGTQLRAHGWWLRENVVGPGGVDPTTREGTLDPTLFESDLAVASAVVDHTGALTVVWTDDCDGSIHPGWLRHVADGRERAGAWLPEHQTWTATTLSEPPTFSGPDVLDDDEALRAWLVSLVRFGIGRLEELPPDDDIVLNVTGRIGPQRATNFGLDWPVKAEILSNNENSTANTTVRLGGHTDLPTREIPPGFQFLHCISNTVAGGLSRMSDGEAIADHLCTHEPEVYDALTTLRWTFFNRSRDHDHRWSGPILDRGAPTSPLSIRAFYPLRAFPDMADADVARAYRAVSRFHQLADDPSFQIGYPFRPGDLVGFDNRRILHGRDAFETGEGHRYLRGTYVDHDEIHSRLRVLERRREAEERSS